MIYTQCNDRHCPGCGWLKRKDWIARVESWELDCSYFHTVFTAPHELSELFNQNRGPSYSLFFRMAQKTLTGICAKEFGCQPGVILTLHTWGQEMRTHVHIHAIVTAGGIPVRKRKSSRALEVTTTSTDDEPPQRWIPIGADAPPFQPRQLADRFRDFLLAGIVQLYRDGLLDLDNVPSMRGIESEDALARWLRPLAERPWVADSKITPEHLQGKDSASRYVSGYMTGTAINNARMRADDGTNVTIDVWDYRTDTWTTETMLGAEFVRRFMLHIVPPTIHRVRYAGCFNARSRKTRLDSIRAMICEHNREHGIDSPHARNDHGGWPSVMQRPKTLRPSASCGLRRASNAVLLG
jgi:hypothetical protein